MGIAKLGGIANYIPSSVIKGMLTSIGILIVAKQIPHAFGYDKDEEGNITELIRSENMHELLQPSSYRSGRNDHLFVSIVMLVGKAFY